MSVSPSDFKVNDIVLFGRPNGEKTRAQVVKINRKKIKVETLEERGRKRKDPAGTRWNVPPTLCKLLKRGGKEVEKLNRVASPKTNKKTY